MEPFYGTVNVSTNFQASDGRFCWSATGMIEVVEAKDGLGVAVHRSESGWCIIVRGTKMVYTIPGCQVIGVVKHEPGEMTLSSWVVP